MPASYLTGLHSCIMPTRTLKQYAGLKELTFLLVIHHGISDPVSKSDKHDKGQGPPADVIGMMHQAVFREGHEKLGMHYSLLVVSTKSEPQPDSPY